MALEDLFFGKNVASALSVGQARGVALLAAAQHTAALLRLHAAGGEEGGLRLGLGRQGPGAADGRHPARPAGAARARPRRRRLRGRDLPRRHRRARAKPSRTSAGRGSGTTPALAARQRLRWLAVAPVTATWMKASGPRPRITRHDRLRQRRGSRAPPRPRRDRRRRRRLPAGRLRRDAEGGPGPRQARLPARPPRRPRRLPQPLRLRQRGGARPLPAPDLGRRRRPEGGDGRALRRAGRASCCARSPPATRSASRPCPGSASGPRSGSSSSCARRSPARSRPTPTSAAIAPGEEDPRALAREGLLNLGYTPPEAEKLLADAEGESPEEIVAVGAPPAPRGRRRHDRVAPDAKRRRSV